jgi:hypothetical protein
MQPKTIQVLIDSRPHHLFDLPKDHAGLFLLRLRRLKRAIARCLHHQEIRSAEIIAARERCRQELLGRYPQLHDRAMAGL